MHIVVDEWVSKLDLNTDAENDSCHAQLEDARQSVGYPGKCQAYHHVTKCNHDSTAKQVVEVASTNAHCSLGDQLEQ